jgi:hypothetical protein
VTHETTIDGLKVKHAIVTKVCRQNRGRVGAIDEALERIRAAYIDSASADANAVASFHVVLTVDRWSDGCSVSPTPAEPK